MGEWASEHIQLPMQQQHRCKKTLTISELLYPYKHSTMNFAPLFFDLRAMWSSAWSGYDAK